MWSWGPVCEIQRVTAAPPVPTLPAAWVRGTQAELAQQCPAKPPPTQSAAMRWDDLHAVVESVVGPDAASLTETEARGRRKATAMLVALFAELLETDPRTAQERLRPLLGELSQSRHDHTRAHAFVLLRELASTGAAEVVATCLAAALDGLLREAAPASRGRWQSWRAAAAALEPVAARPQLRAAFARAGVTVWAAAHLLTQLAIDAEAASPRVEALVADEFAAAVQRHPAAIADAGYEPRVFRLFQNARSLGARAALFHVLWSLGLRRAGVACSADAAWVAQSGLAHELHVDPHAARLRAEELAAAAATAGVPRAEVAAGLRQWAQLALACTAPTAQAALAMRGEARGDAEAALAVLQHSCDERLLGEAERVLASAPDGGAAAAASPWPHVKHAFIRVVRQMVRWRRRAAGGGQLRLSMLQGLLEDVCEQLLPLVAAEDVDDVGLAVGVLEALLDFAQTSDAPGAPPFAEDSPAALLLSGHLAFAPRLLACVHADLLSHVVVALADVEERSPFLDDVQAAAMLLLTQRYQEEPLSQPAVAWFAGIMGGDGAAAPHTALFASQLLLKHLRTLPDYHRLLREALAVAQLHEDERLLENPYKLCTLLLSAFSSP